MTTESSVPAERVRMRLGISPLSWVNEVLEDLGRGTSAETILTDAKAAGFEGVEVNVPGIDVDEVNQASKASGLIVDGSVGGGGGGVTVAAGLGR